MEKNKKNKTPWPTKAAMDQIYKKQLWGSNGLSFYSGEGSHKQDIVNPYIKKLTTFFKSFKEPISVADLGCGDFNIGKQLIMFTKSYVAVDIVEELINYNKTHFKAKNLNFSCLDIAKDQLPLADCVILRQVLQHLSNKEVESIVNKLYAFKYVIITEHLPEGDFIPNKDIISGQGIRLKKQSGVDVLAAPFLFKVKNVKHLFTVKLEKNKGVIKTVLYEVY
ncbi:methyltransferase family protein [Lacinutrix venerupis]|uniref:class I SAM-dependent methyltransferase n=1 Tax=Lacinutrix venerupis TaxID=1486034 RepID=UPI000EB47592|nr:class I SAM-dependent methyltransferase [Lacinutrix venerupis]RLJ64504.1 methyltransferase family protein [Lacinutrix venerupis]